MAIPDIFNLTLDNQWNLYWYQAEALHVAETEIEDLLTRRDNMDMDTGLAQSAGWQVDLENKPLL